MIGLRSCARSAAEYCKSQVPFHSNNPLILALDKQFSDEDAFAAMARKVDFRPEWRDLCATDRYNFLSDLGGLVIPTEDTIVGYRKLAMMHRGGYRDRNPMVATVQQRLNKLSEIAKDLQNADFSRFTYHPSTNGLITGIAGTGKSTLVRCYLDSFRPGCFIHSKFNGRDLNITQIPSLVMENCFDGSCRGMLLWGLKELGRLAGENFEKNIRVNATAYDIMWELVKQLVRYHVGMVCLDEAEFIRAQYREGNAKEVFCWMNLMNISGVPLVLISNPEIEEIMEKWAKVGMRFASGCRLRMLNLERGEELDEVMDTIWEYQFLRTFTPLTNELRNVFYHYTQGIHRLKLNLYGWVQELTISRGGDERITPRLVQEAAEKNAHDLQPVLRALQQNSAKEYMPFEDLGRRPIPRKASKKSLIFLPKKSNATELPQSDQQPPRNTRYKLGKKSPIPSPVFGLQRSMATLHRWQPWKSTKFYVTARSSGSNDRSLARPIPRRTPLFGCCPLPQNPRYRGFSIFA